MKTKQKIAVPILADREVFDYLKEKVGERKTKTEAFCDLLDKSLAGFVSPFLRNKGYELQPNQCHVTVSDLSSEWHWHRATVRSFLDVMEEFGLLNRIRLSKSVIITMTVQTSQSTESCNGQKKLNLAEQLREALSDWIIGKVSLDEIGIKCEQLVRRAMDEAGICDSCPSPDSITRINPAADDDERAVHCGRQRHRPLYNGHCVSRDSMTVQSLWTTSDWNCMGTGQDLLQLRKVLPGLFLM